MEKSKMIEVCREYDDLLKADGFVSKHREPLSNEYDMNHIRWMVNEIPKIIENPEKEAKANRWLGFVQGVLSMKGYYTIDEMKGHNRSDKKSSDSPKVGETYYWFEGGYMMYGD